MNLIMNLKYYHIDGLCYFLGLVSIFISIALVETNAGQFLVFPLLVVSAVSSSVLSIMYCCDIPEEHEYIPVAYDEV